MTLTFFFRGFDRIFFARSHSLRGVERGFLTLFFFPTKLSKTLSVRLIHFFIFSVFFEFFWVFFLNFLSNPRVRAVLLLYSKTSVSHCSPPHPHPLWVENPQGVGGGCGGVEAPAGAKLPTSARMSPPLRGRPPRCLRARPPASQRG